MVVKSIFFGFNFNDDVNYTSTTKFKWVNSGGGINFVLNPAGSNYTLGAIANFTKIQH